MLRCWQPLLRGLTKVSPYSTVRTPLSASDSNYCLEHQISGHHFTKSKKIAIRPIEERRAVVKDNMLCFACMHAGHRSKDCTNHLTCDKCAGKHPTVLHYRRSARIIRT